MTAFAARASRLIVAMGALFALPFAHAQQPTIPEGPITIIVGQPPGGTTDISARTFAERLTALMGRSVIVENKPGVSGVLAAAQVARAPGDGRTLLYSPNTLMSAPHLLPKDSGITVDVLKDLVPIIATTSSSIALVANPSLGIKDAKQLVALLKKKDNNLSFASAGNGSNMHIAGAMFLRSAGVEMQHVPYKGVAPALTDVVAGHVKLGFISLSLVAPYIASGRLVGLGVSQNERNKLLPNLPTLKEQGYDNTDATVWFGVFAPKATSPALATYLNKAFNDAMNEPEMQARLMKQWELPVGGPASTLKAMSEREYTTTGEIIRALKITAD